MGSAVSVLSDALIFMYSFLVWCSFSFELYKMFCRYRSFIWYFRNIKYSLLDGLSFSGAVILLLHRSLDLCTQTVITAVSQEFFND